MLVNDIQSRLNATDVAELLVPSTADEVAGAVRAAAATGRAISIAGGRHAMGGQQFGQGTLLLDMRRLDRMLELDLERGVVRVEAGIQWPALLAGLAARQAGSSHAWTIRQKQTGADRLTLGGAVAANVHGRGLKYRPIVGDIEGLTLVGPDGRPRLVNRSERADLFGLVVGGYGLFGVVTEVSLRLVPRRKLERRVEIRPLDGLMAAMEQRIADGFCYGDFQFATDDRSDDFLSTGVFACYRPVPDDTPFPARTAVLSSDDWRRLILLTHHDKGRAFREYADHYRRTDGQLYWSDDHQLSEYFDDYHDVLERALGDAHAGTEMITELYVPRPSLEAFMAQARTDLRARGANVIYGTIRLIERDPETFLAWAREPWACVIFNLHVTHTPEGLRRAAEAFRALIDLALAHGGSYYLTYHRWALAEQVDRAYPRFREFLARKRMHDPDERFQSSWYRHYRELYRIEAAPRP